MNWKLISCMLCVFGCLKDFRPSESFVTDYLTGPWKNFTETQVNRDIYPIGTYAYFATLVIVFLITDFVRYKPVIILCGLSGVTAFVLMIVGQTILSIQIVEFFYGLILSAEVAYYTYIYAKVDKEHYQEVTGHTKAASLVGRCMAGLIAQLTRSYNLLDYHELNYLTLSAYAFATIWACFLPSVEQSMYFHRRSEDNEKDITLSPKTKKSLALKVKQAYGLLWKDFLQAYSNSYVVKWSIWWAASTCGYLQATSYMQLIWQTAVEPGDIIYNGAVDFFYAIIGAVSVFLIGKLQLNWSLIGDVAVAVTSFMMAIILFLSAYIYNIWALYTIYIVFGVVYHTIVTVASFEVAKCISEDSHGLIFGANIFFALLLQSLLTFIVVNGNLALSIRAQYVVYGGYFAVIAALYMISGIFIIIKQCKNGIKFKVWMGVSRVATHGEDESRSSKTECSS